MKDVTSTKMLYGFNGSLMHRELSEAPFHSRASESGFPETKLAFSVQFQRLHTSRNLSLCQAERVVLKPSLWREGQREGSDGRVEGWVEGVWGWL